MQAIKVMRALRLMRLVRLIARSPSMLNVVQSISLSVKEMSNVVLIQLLIITIFAILGVQLFAGKLYYCNDPSATGKADCVGAPAPYSSLPPLQLPTACHDPCMVLCRHIYLLQSQSSTLLQHCSTPCPWILSAQSS